MGVGPGFAVASAIYCQDHEPGKRVICVEGDSAFGFSGLEFETAARLFDLKIDFCCWNIDLFVLVDQTFSYNLPIIFIVINNGGIYAGVDGDTFRDMAKTDAALK